MSTGKKLPKPGQAGASVRRDYVRRAANREQRVRAGEECVAESLARAVDELVVLLHDRRVPRSRANIDHIAVAPSGVWVIDAKRHAGRVEIRKPLFGAPRLFIAGRDRSKLADGLERQVFRVGGALAAGAPEVPVYGAFAIVDAELPIFGHLSFRDFPLLYPHQLAQRLNEPGPVAGQRIPDLVTQLSRRFPSA